MRTCQSCSKWTFLVIFSMLMIFLYFIFLLRTYDTTVDKAQVRTSFDVFSKKHRLQNHNYIKRMPSSTPKTKLQADEIWLAQDEVKFSGNKKNKDNLVHGHGLEMGNKQGGWVNDESLLPNESIIPTGNVMPKLKPEHNVPGHRGIKTNTARILDSIISSGNVSITYSENVDFGSGSYKAFWVDSEGTLLQRVTNYNNAIHKFRKQLIEKRGDRPWQAPTGVMKSLWCNRDDFHKELDIYPAVKTIALSWHRRNVGNVWNSSVDTHNILLQDYYMWTGSKRLCRWIQTAGFTRARWDAVYNRSCATLANLTSLTLHVQLETVYLHGKPINKNHYWPHHGIHYPQYFYTTTPPHVLYMHVMEDSVVTSLGDVITGNLKLIPYSCSQDIGATAPHGFLTSPLYDEVFIMGQYWGASFFHLMVENLPRIAPYLEFLKANPHVMIHAQAVDGYTAQAIELLGLNRTRLIKGTVRARRVYLSQATPCGLANLQELQILARHYRNYLQLLPVRPLQRRPSILLIRRSGSRRFTQHSRIQSELEQIAVDFDLEFELFIDNPSPSMQAAMLMFNRAALVVGPHGAGLSNLVYCKPGTLVIEGVCNPPHVNMCYQWTAHVLGLRYHGIGSRRGCESWIDVDYTLVSNAAQQLLKTSTN